MHFNLWFEIISYTLAIWVYRSTLLTPDFNQQSLKLTEQENATGPTMLNLPDTPCALASVIIRTPLKRTKSIQPSKFFFAVKPFLLNVSTPPT